MRAILCCAAAIMAGCSATAKIPDVVRVPVPVPCLEALLAAAEVASDDSVLAMDDYRAVLTMWRDRLAMRVAYDELRAMASACVK